MKVQEIEEKVAKEFELLKVQAKKIIEFIVATIAEGLKKDKEVKLKGLGTFRIKETPAKKGVKVRNPMTGEEKVKDIPAKKKVKFTAAKALKEKIL